MLPNAGVGVFSTRPLYRGELILPVGEMDIPIVDRLWHTGISFWPVGQYVWTKHQLSEQDTKALNDVQVFGTGFDSCLNTHMLLQNAVSLKSENNRVGLKLGRDAEASGITPYWNSTYKVIANIPAGGEIFNMYGKEW